MQRAEASKNLSVEIKEDAVRTLLTARVDISRTRQSENVLRSHFFAARWISCSRSLPSDTRDPRVSMSSAFGTPSTGANSEDSAGWSFCISMSRLGLSYGWA